MHRTFGRVVVALAVISGVVAVGPPSVHAGSAAQSTGSLVFIKDNNVWLSKPDGSAQTQVTTDGTAAQPYRHPSQSDDGTIAAVRNVIVSSGNGQGVIFVMDRQGNWKNGTPIQPPQLNCANQCLNGRRGEVQSNGGINNAHISPDGTRIAYSNPGLYIDDTGAYRTFTNSDVVHSDGTYVASETNNVLGLTSDANWITNNQLVLNGVRYFNLGGSTKNSWYSAYPGGDQPEAGAGIVLDEAPKFVAISTLNGAPPTQPTYRCAVSNDAGTYRPSLSPDGKAMAYQVGDGTTYASVIRVVTFDPGWDCNATAASDTTVISDASEPDWGPTDVGGGTTKTNTTTSVAVSPSSPSSTDAVTFTATVTPSTGSGTPTGTVTFLLDGRAICTSRPLSGGSATCQPLGDGTNPSGTHTVTANYSGDSSFNASSGSATFTVSSGGGTATAGHYHPVTPTRILDTRGAPFHTPSNGPSTVGAYGDLNFKVTGTFGPQGTTVTVPDDATAVVMNVAEVNGTQPGNFTLYPTGAAFPNTANANWGAGQTVSNLVEVAIGAGGQVSLHNASGAAADVVYDLAGYVGPSSDSAGRFVPIAPTRLMDTRGAPFHVGSVNGPMASGTPAAMQVTGVAPIPATGVSAVVFNVTATQQTGDGNLTIYPHGASAPNVANLNYRGGEDIGNRVVVPVSADGRVDVNNYTPSGSVQIIADAVGYFTDATATATTGTTFTGITPNRIADTRAGQFHVGANNTLGDQSTITVPVAGTTGVPAGAKGVVLNVAVTNTAQPSYLIAFPSDTAAPNAADINWLPGVTRSNLVPVKLGADGGIKIHNYQGAVDVIVDVLGWYG